MKPKTNNQVVWITGASSGIGEALVYTFARQGYRLIISSRNANILEEVKARCVSGSEVKIIPLDISDISSIQNAAQTVFSQYSTIDILINNAGVSQRSLAEETDFQVDQMIIQTNLLGTIALTKAVLNKMILQKSGHIVTVSSLMGKFGTPLRSSYAAAKHGLHGFFDSLRAEVASRNIFVTLICPGFVRTNVSLNALTANGEKQNTMDDATQEGLTPEYASEQILKAILSKKEEVYIGGKEVLGIYVKRWFPSVFSKIITKFKTV